MREKGSETRYEFKLNFKEITLFIVGSVGVISLFFIIGIWIGKSLNAVPGEILGDEYVTSKNFPTADDEADDDETEIDMAVQEDETSYEFQKSLSKKEIIPLKEETKIKIIKETGADSSSAKKKKEAIDNFTVPTKAVSSKKKPKVLETKKKKQAPAKRGKYTVQVASFKGNKDALKLVSRLKKKGYDAYFVATNIKDKGMWYRVRVGNYFTQKDAKKIIKLIEKNIKLKGMVVRDSRN